MLWISLYLVMQVLVTTGQGFVYQLQFMVFRHREISPEQIEAMLDRNVLPMLIISALLSLLIYWIAFRVRRRNLWTYCRFSKPGMSVILLAMVLGVSFNLLFLTFDMVTSFDRLFPDYGQVVEPLMSGGFGFTLMIAGILIPIFEEILFRGMVFNRIKTFLPVGAAIGLQGFLFGAYHLNILQGIYGMILGILAALVYQWFRSLWVPIAVHIAFNSFSIIISRIPNIEIIFQQGMLLLIGSGALLALTLFFLWQSHCVFKLKSS